MADTGVHVIIHGASVAAGGIGAGLAQIPGADMPVLAGLQATMIMGIAQQYNVTLQKWAAADLVMTFAASMAGRGISQVLIGWFPGIGNAINASTAAALTEAIGWAADAYFKDEGNRRKHSAQKEEKS